MRLPRLSPLLAILCVASFALVSPAPAGEAPPGREVKPELTRQPGAGLAAGQITWLKDYAAALAKAEKDQKPVLVDVFTTWCGPCKMLDRETFGDANVIRYVQRFFVALKIDADKHPELRQKHEVTGYPTVLFLSPDGAEIGRILGFRGPKDFLTEAGKAARSSATLEKLQSDAEAKPEDVEAQRAWALALLAAGSRDRAVKVLKDCIDKKPEAVEARLDLAAALLAGRELRPAAEQYEAAIAGASATPEAKAATARARVALARTRLALREPKAAETVLSAALDSELTPKTRLEALFLRAYTRSLLRQAEGALADLAAAEKADPEGSWGYRASLIRDLVSGDADDPSTSDR